MSRSPRLRLASLFVFGFLPLLTVASTSTVADGGARRNVSSLVFPPNAHPYGKSHGEWVAEFWQYALEFPVEGHPFLDTPEYDFAARQSGKVWFWSAPDGPITREVDIPHGTALFLTIRDVEVSSLEEPPFFGATEQEQRERANWFADRIVDVSVTIDGVPVENVEDYRFESPQFSFDAPTPWIFGATGGAGTSVGDGYYMMIKPLPVGTHTIEYSGTFHFEAGELGDWQTEPLDLPHSGTIILNVVREQ
ncbi:MAG TPA: hypothetical protein VFB66_10185 [Tepidisphaeraceae bacterium]|nr:hypothetical protein [Tepidisphaeraceae bacterium]